MKRNTGMKPGSELVDVAWLSTNAGSVVLLDASIRRTPTGGFAGGEADFELEHLPGAQFADLFGAFSDPQAPFLFTRPTPVQVEAAARALGIDDSSTVVVYDRLTGAWAARLWWVLRSYGLTDVYVLDGGMNAWTSAGLAVESGPAPAISAPGSFTACPQDGFFIDLDAVQQLAETPDPATPVVCAVRRPEYLGEGGGPRAGHIPNSVSLPYPDLLDADGLLSPDRIRSRAGQLGLSAADRVVLYCGGAINAAGLALALAEVGVDRVTIYDGSLNEWRADPSLPLVVGDPGSQP